MSFASLRSVNPRVLADTVTPPVAGRVPRSISIGHPFLVSMVALLIPIKTLILTMVSYLHAP